MSLPARRRVTYNDLFQVPDHLVAEIIDGELYTSPRPAPRHSRAASALGSEIHGPFDREPGDPRGPGGWWILYEPELHLGDDILVPDLAGWRRSHLPAIPDEAYFTLEPDWVCEVLSPSTERLDRARKIHLYARYGVQHLWLVNPLIELFEIWRLEGEQWLLVATYTGDDRVRAEPFEAVELELSRWWSRRPPEPAPPAGQAP